LDISEYLVVVVHALLVDTLIDFPADRFDLPGTPIGCKISSMRPGGVLETIPDGIRGYKSQALSPGRIVEALSEHTRPPDLLSQLRQLGR
jgi:hypothetical protein